MHVCVYACMCVCVCVYVTLPFSLGCSLRQAETSRAMRITALASFVAATPVGVGAGWALAANVGAVMWHLRVAVFELLHFLRWCSLAVARDFTVWRKVDGPWNAVLQATAAGSL